MVLCLLVLLDRYGSMIVFIPAGTDSDPIPTPRVKRKQIVYDFASMRAGDSLLAPPEDAHRVRMAALSWAKKRGRSVASRKQPDGSLRVWLVS